MPIAAAIPYIVAAASTAASVASTVQQRNAANAAAGDALTASGNAAAVTQATAAYNARVDRADEQQVALDSAANIDAMRRDAATYLSRQKAAFAGAGVNVDSGSPLAVRVATAGQLALREQEAHRQANARLEGIESKAQAGLAEGESQADAYRIEGRSQADAYHRKGTAAVLSGASRLISSLGSYYQGGLFSGAGNAGLSESPISPE